jgi:hypothetical protein
MIHPVASTIWMKPALTESQSEFLIQLSHDLVSSNNQGGNVHIHVYMYSGPSDERTPDGMSKQHFL